MTDTYDLAGASGFGEVISYNHCGAVQTSSHISNSCGGSSGGSGSGGGCGGACGGSKGGPIRV